MHRCNTEWNDIWLSLHMAHENRLLTDVLLVCWISRVCHLVAITGITIPISYHPCETTATNLEVWEPEDYSQAVHLIMPHQQQPQWPAAGWISFLSLVATRFRVAVICLIIQVPHCIRVFFYFVWFVFINHIFQFYYELCTYCNILDIYLS